VGVKGYLPEVYALGLRNPWRCGSDPLTGAYFCGDDGAVPYGTALYCTVLNCPVLYCTILYCTEVYFNSMLVRGICRMQCTPLRTLHPAQRK